MSIREKSTLWTLPLLIALAIVLSGSLAQGIGQQRSNSVPKSQTLVGDQQTEQAEFHIRVALAAMNDGDLTIAAREFAEAGRLAPSNAKVWYNLGILESKRSNHAVAVEHFKRALQLGLPATEKALADDYLAESTYRMKKTGSDVRSVLYGLGFGLTLDQLVSRRGRLGPREASAYGDRYTFEPPEDLIGSEEKISLYFGNDGLQRIWVQFPGGFPAEAGRYPEFNDKFRAVERLLVSRGFTVDERVYPPQNFRQDDGGSRNPLPSTIRFRNGMVRAALSMRLTFWDNGRLSAENLILVIWDSERCRTCNG